MTLPDDRPHEMLADRDADRDTDLAFDALLRGRDPGDRYHALATLDADLRVVTGGPAPAPSPALATLLAGRPRHRAGWASRVAGMSVAAKLAGGAAFAFAGVATAGAAGVLPPRVANLVRPVIELVTPFEVPASGGTSEPAHTGVTTVPPAAGESTEATSPASVPSDPPGQENENGQAAPPGQSNPTGQSTPPGQTNPPGQSNPSGQSTPPSQSEPPARSTQPAEPVDAARTVEPTGTGEPAGPIQPARPAQPAARPIEPPWAAQPAARPVEPTGPRGPARTAGRRRTARTALTAD